MSNDSLGDRMKGYENITRGYLTRRVPVIIRVDGKAFHTVTREFGKGWSELFTNMMISTAGWGMKQIQGCSLAYCQSDEISYLLTDYRTVNTDTWFGYNIQKLASITAAAVSAKFSLRLNKEVMFDARVFNIPQDEVCNYFIWRQQDATRNAVQFAGHENFSHKELHKKSCNDIQEMLFKKKLINFNDYPIIRKRGFCIVDDVVDSNIPIFTQDREYIEKHVNVRED